MWPDHFLHRLFFVALASALLSGCVETTVDSFRKVPGAAADEAYIREGTDFSRYRRLLLYPLEIYYSDCQCKPDPGGLERIRGIFRSAFQSAIGDAYEIVDAPGPDVLGVRASLVDLKTVPVYGELPLKGRAAALIANGQLTLFIEVSDTRSGTVLGRAADREKPSDAVPEAAGTDRQWAETEAAARRWAAMFRDFLDRNLGA